MLASARCLPCGRARRWGTPGYRGAVRAIPRVHTAAHRVGHRPDRGGPSRTIGARGTAPRRGEESMYPGMGDPGLGRRSSPCTHRCRSNIDKKRRDSFRRRSPPASDPHPGLPPATLGWTLGRSRGYCRGRHRTKHRISVMEVRPFPPRRRPARCYREDHAP